MQLNACFTILFLHKQNKIKLYDFLDELQMLSGNRSLLSLGISCKPHRDIMCFVSRITFLVLIPATF